MSDELEKEIIDVEELTEDIPFGITEEENSENQETNEEGE